MEDPDNLYSMAKNEYSSAYPIIANEIIKKFQINKGICIDVGTGPAPLAIAIAKITNLKIYAMDISEEMCQIAGRNITVECLQDRIIPIHGDVSKMPFEDDFADIIISRGSMFFWKDLSSGFKEIYRVLKPGSGAYVGGGYGSRRVKEKIKGKFTNKSRDSGKNFYKSPPKIDIDTLELAVTSAGIEDYILINDDSGLWVTIRKNQSPILIND
jgi:SAM-dependent methyltransferase